MFVELVIALENSKQAYLQGIVDCILGLAGAEIIKPLFSYYACVCLIAFTFFWCFWRKIIVIPCAVYAVIDEKRCIYKRNL